MLAVLRQRSFALLWAAGLVSSLGDYFLFVALPFYVYGLTGSALATGGMFIAESLPSILLGSLAGVFADRWDRRRTMIVADACRAGLLLLLLTARSSETVWVVYVVSFAQSAIGQFFGPAKNALIPHLVGAADLLPANSLVSVTGQVTMLVGPALGGMVLGLLGLPGVVLSDSLSFLFSAGMVGLIGGQTSVQAVVTPVAPLASSPVAAVWREFRQGLALTRQTRLISALLVVTGLGMLAQGIVNVLIIPFVKDVLHGDAIVLGWVMSAQGVGGLIGGVLIGHLGRRWPPSRLLAVGLLAVGALVVATVNAGSLALVLSLVAFIGVGSVATAVSTQTLLQVAVVDRYRGRVFGAYGTVQATLALVGMGLASVLGHRFGTVPFLDLAGLLWFVSGAAAAVTLPRVAPVAVDVEPVDVV